MDERKETEQRSLFDLFQRAMGAKKFILQTKDGNRLRQSELYYKDRSHLLPKKTPYLVTDFINPFSTFSEINRTSLRKEGLSLNVVVSNLLWFNEWHQRISSYYLHGLGIHWRKLFSAKRRKLLKLISVDRVLHGNDAIFRESVSTPNET